MAHRPNSLVIRSRVEARTSAQKEIFISALERLLNVSVACRVTGLTRSMVYAWRKDDEQFANDWDNAIDFANGSIESATYLKLADVLQDKHKRVSMPEARLIELYLTAAYPDKYKRAGIDIEVNQLSVTIDWSKIPDDMVNAFNANQITLQDVYEYWTLQSKEQAKSDPSTD